MSAVLNNRTHLHAAGLGLIAAVFSTSVTMMTYRGISAPGPALACLALFALMLMSLLVCTRPSIALAISLIFMTSPASLFLSSQWSALVSAFLLAGTALGLILRTTVRAMLPDQLFCPIGIFTAYGLLSATYGLFLGNEIGYLLGDSFQLVEFAAVYFLAVQLLHHDKDIYLFLKLVLASMLFTVMLELALFALRPGAADFLPSWDGSFISGSLVRTIDIDATILFAVLMNLYPVASSRRQRLWIALALVPIGANIALSLSRGLWFCTLASAVASVFLASRKARKRLLITLALVTLAFVAIAGTWKISSGSEGDADVSLLSVLQERVFYGADQVALGLAGTESMATRRFLEMAIVGPQVFAKPWIGHGLGATYVIGGYAVLDSGTNELIDHHFIHNLYLVTAFRMGVIGLGLLLWMLVRYFRTVLRASRSLPPTFSRGLITGLVASVVGQLLLSLTQPTLIDHPTCGLIACAMALSLRLASPGLTNYDSILKVTNAS